MNAVLPQLQDEYGTWGFFKGFSTRNIQQTAAELKGEKKVPVPAEEPAVSK